MSNHTCKILLKKHRDKHKITFHICVSFWWVVGNIMRMIVIFFIYLFFLVNADLYVFVFLWYFYKVCDKVVS